MSQPLVLTFDAFGADLAGKPDAWEAFAEAIEQGHSPVETVTLRVASVEQLVTSRDGSNLVFVADPDHLSLLAALFRGLARAGREAGPNPTVVRHAELEPEPYLSWMAPDALPVHLICEPLN